MRRPGLLTLLLLVILLLCAGLIYLDQTGALGGAGTSSSFGPGPTHSGSSGSGTTNDPYGGLK
ncbi:hypothetical protein GCM10022631_41450 [Deinococcus rubellus]|uniref:Uncharacterized protein n=1 Tax=Deinococcus rubellus TaxID=1889240 RepID=A0ABY5YK46_9DEIO|nr:hypothetical protein [Deinococcus rubellus]UWX65071.1 hypothetical protein N0D28_05285 [Deinococcus rubellus]